MLSAARRQGDALDARSTTPDRRAPLIAGEPKPLESVGTFWRVAAQVSTIGIFLLLFGAMLDLARAVLLPTVSAFVIGTMLGPVSARAERLGVPPWLSATVLILLILGVFNGVIILLSAPIVEWAGRLPELGASIKAKLHVFDRPWEAFQGLRRALLPTGGDEPLKVDVIAFLSPVLIALTPAAGQLLIFFGTLFFFLYGRARIRKVLVVFFDDRAARLRTIRILNDTENNLTRYLGTVTLINVGLAVVCAFAYWVVGMPNAIALGVLAGVLNYIPYVGPLMMEVILFAVGLVAFPSLSYALLGPAVHFGITTIEGHFITPGIIGRSLTMNPLTVFLALVFWTWLWGPVGAFLSIPLLIVGKVAMAHLFPKDEATTLPG
jgi:predicted PurR-regulated permease PerM